MTTKTEATIVLATIAADWRLRHVPGVVVRPLPRVTLRPHPLRMRLTQRHRSKTLQGISGER